jgi:hypothetical protein
MPWKVLLKMGKLKPSPEAIDMFISMGDKTVKRAKDALLDILVHDIYWGVITPSQALLMLYGLPPPTPKETVKGMREIFVEKEKMLEAKFVNILEKVVGKYKEFEHETLKEIKGQELDELIKGTEEYIERLKELRGQIEKRSQGKTIEEIYKQVFELLKPITNKSTNSAIIEEFEKLIKEGKFNSQNSKIIKNIIDAKEDFKKGKTNINMIENVRKESTSLINSLIEYSQRKDLMDFDKRRMILKYHEKDKDKAAEILAYDKEIFLFKDGKIKKITNKIEESNMEEVSKAMSQQKEKKSANLSSEMLTLLKKELGDFEISL